MSSKNVLTEILEFMDELQEVGKDCLITDGHLTLSVRYKASDHSSEKEELQKVLATIIRHIPLTFEMGPDVDWLDVVQVVVDTRDQRIEVKLELPLIIFPDSQKYQPRVML